jgi:hypothetical protein
MIDTRPEMTRAQFEAAADFTWNERSWLTGEEHFLHVPAVMQVKDWNLYGKSGNKQLTEPQRVLMMWSDLVGQVSNGGFEQFAYNLRKSLRLAYQLIEKLEWPELFERFDLAFREQATGSKNRSPQLSDDEMYAAEEAYRKRMIRDLARIETKGRPWARRRAEASYEPFTVAILSTWHNKAIERGDIVPEKQTVIEAKPPPTEAAEAFDEWFYLDETRKASKAFVGAYIRRHRDQLCRLID